MSDNLSQDDLRVLGKIIKLERPYECGPIEYKRYYFYPCLEDTGSYIITATDPSQVIEDEDIMELVKYNYSLELVVVEPYDEQQVKLLKRNKRRYATIVNGRLIENRLKYLGVKIGKPS
ncbi:hypothetical protein [Sulfolobus ellipsoid virus 1]|uniref:Uncharacterized protein n=1 Tax=Sulfolobus ellipsoid virus 1 TaxID=2056194 RepID=A0A2H4RBQ0_9VIRU|nr:hypothetical protein FGG62_gp35 [Sulfolobus ellipsoid virus 1]ATY46513.1 hypothetical protein [Sulfolobus ellipsoid virus 1]